ncbi:PilZ domain-containing protein [Candidatus Venteria ishoeyi]|nr:PilZ domain-containing protein [Candidatus Venteria ishoeyi]MDM8547582.1 PilZ domain-containing protein [Candidatus Venteria ishoeyi]
MDSTLAKERRRSKRRELLLFLPVYYQETGEVLGHLADLTPEGLMLFSQECIELGKKYALEIHIEDLRNALIYQRDADPGFNTIQMTARSRWIAINPDLYRTGFMFTDISEQALDAIEHIVESLDKLV